MYLSSSCDSTKLQDSDGLHFPVKAAFSALSLLRLHMLTKTSNIDCTAHAQLLRCLLLELLQPLAPV
jgi:hypothetical protein